jgi:hypothetical protein
VPHYVSFPAFQELAPAALNAVNKYAAKHPDFKLPETFPRLVGLVARVKDVPVTSAKKGEPSAPPSSCLILLMPRRLLAATSAANLRPEKGKKGKVTLPFLSCLSGTNTSCCTVQTKRPRLSKETVDSDDEEIAAFLEDSPNIPCEDCGPGSGHSFESCPELPPLPVDMVRATTIILFIGYSILFLLGAGHRAQRGQCRPNGR